MKKILKNKLFVQSFIIAIICLLLILGTLFFLKKKDRVSIDTSIISAPLISINPTSPGKIKEIDVIEGQKINKGDVIAVVGSEILYANNPGIIVSTNKQIGNISNPTSPIIQMINIADMRVDGTIDENKGLNNIKVGQVVSFTVDALPGKTFWGYVDEISPSAKQTQASFSISTERATQQFDIFAHFDASNHPEIKNGMSSKMTVYTKN